MFRNLLIILTTTAVTCHALLGCCAHHAHNHQALSNQHGEQVVTEESHDHHNCSASHHKAKSQETIDTDSCSQHTHDQHPCGDEPCSEVECSFVSTGRLNDVELSTTSWAVLPASLTNSSEALLDLLHYRDRFANTGNCNVVRAVFAFKQVWLL